MGQRVNIQYSIELDDLQDEINRLFSNCISELDKVSPIGGTPVVKLGTDGLEKIDFIRRKLEVIDIMLRDIQNIIEGYVRYKTEPHDSKQTEPLNESEELEIEQLADKLAKFKEMLNAQSNKESQEADE